jgi:HPt (histidine-containing phosphotransfer) domain-containing protein
MNANVTTSNFTIAQFDPAKFNHFTKGYDTVRPQIIAAFLEETPSVLQELDQALTESLATRTGQLVHKLKSSCSLFCTDDLQHDLSEMERNAINVQTAEFLSFGKSVIMRVGGLVKELQQLDNIA